MWWINAFDKSLKGLDTAEEGKVVQTLTNGGLDMVAKGGSKFVGTGGLYASFVRGESLSGTITPEETEEVPATKKQRRGEDRHETKEERRARKAAKRAARARRLSAAEPVALVLTSELAQINEEEEDFVVEEAETKE
jgi:nucleolar protein TMA23